MASAPHKTTITRTVNNRTGITRSTSVFQRGGSTTVTRTTTIGKAKKAASSGKKSASSPAKAAGAVLADTRWITGPNDCGWAMCAPVAVANCLLAATGLEAGNGDMERLYRAAGGIGDSGVPLLPVLAAAASTGLAGCRLASYAPALPDDADLVLLALAGLTGLHAAAVTGEGAVMWGAAVPLAELDAHVIDAWSLQWHGLETSCLLPA